MVAAQGIVLFTAGFESVASSLIALCYNLATNPAVQERIHEEVVHVWEDEVLTAECAVRLRYLEAAILETLRLFPQAATQSRICTRDSRV